MKSLFFYAALVAPALAQTSQFTNTSFAGPFTVGQSVPIMWTTGNGLPISLAIANSTWNYTVFSDRAVLPATYNWIVSALPGLVSGNYQLSLDQMSAGVSTSPSFGIIVPDSASEISTTTAGPMPTATVTYVFWDDQCGCTKTGSALTPLNTSLPVTTTKWWDESCGCHMSAVIPVTTMPAANNYTLSSGTPPMMTGPAQTVAPATPTAASSTTLATFTGEAGRLTNSGFALAALIAAIVVA